MTELQRAYQIGAWISGGVVNSPVGSGGEAGSSGNMAE